MNLKSKKVLQILLLFFCVSNSSYAESNAETKRSVTNLINLNLYKRFNQDWDAVAEFIRGGQSKICDLEKEVKDLREATVDQTAVRELEARVRTLEAEKTTIENEKAALERRVVAPAGVQPEELGRVQDELRQANVERERLQGELRDLVNLQTENARLKVQLKELARLRTENERLKGVQTANARLQGELREEKEKSARVEELEREKIELEGKKKASDDMAKGLQLGLKAQHGANRTLTEQLKTLREEKRGVEGEVAGLRVKENILENVQKELSDEKENNARLLREQAEGKLDVRAEIERLQKELGEQEKALRNKGELTVQVATLTERLKEIEGLRKRNGQLLGQIKTLNVRLEKIAELKDINKDQAAEINDSLLMIEELKRARTNALVKQKKNFEARIATLRDCKSDLEDQINRLTKGVRAETEKTARLEGERKTLNAELGRLRVADSANIKLAADLEELKNLYGTAHVANDILSKANVGLKKKNSALEREKQTFGEQKRTADERVAKLEADLGNAQTELGDLRKSQKESTRLANQRAKKADEEKQQTLKLANQLLFVIAVSDEIVAKDVLRLRNWNDLGDGKKLEDFVKKDLSLSFEELEGVQSVLVGHLHRNLKELLSRDFKRRERNRLSMSVDDLQREIKALNAENLKLMEVKEFTETERKVLEEELDRDIIKKRAEIKSLDETIKALRSKFKFDENITANVVAYKNIVASFEATKLSYNKMLENIKKHYEAPGSVESMKPITESRESITKTGDVRVNNFSELTTRYKTHLNAMVQRFEILMNKVFGYQKDLLDTCRKKLPRKKRGQR